MSHPLPVEREGNVEAPSSPVPRARWKQVLIVVGVLFCTLFQLVVLPLWLPLFH